METVITAKPVMPATSFDKHATALPPIGATIAAAEANDPQKAYKRAARAFGTSPSKANREELMRTAGALSEWYKSTQF